MIFCQCCCTCDSVEYSNIITSKILLRASSVNKNNSTNKWVVTKQDIISIGVYSYDYIEYDAFIDAKNHYLSLINWVSFGDIPLDTDTYKIIEYEILPFTTNPNVLVAQKIANIKYGVV